MKVFITSIILSAIAGQAYADVCGSSCAITRNIIKCDCFVEDDNGQSIYISSVIGSNQRGTDAFSAAENACVSQAWKHGDGIIKNCHVIQ